MVTVSDAFIAKIKHAKYHFPVRVTYQETLEFLYWCCIASERLLVEAFNSCAIYPECGELGDYYLRHSQEEKDEIKYLLGDLKAANREIQPLPNPVAMALVGSQYYLLKHLHPACLLGYMAVQEAVPTPMEVVKSVEKFYGKDQVTFIRMHAINDLEHRKPILDLIDAQDDQTQAFIWFSIENTLDYLGQFHAGGSD